MKFKHGIICYVIIEQNNIITSTLEGRLGVPGNKGIVSREPGNMPKFKKEQGNLVSLAGIKQNSCFYMFFYNLLVEFATGRIIRPPCIYKYIFL